MGGKKYYTLANAHFFSLWKICTLTGGGILSPFSLLISKTKRLTNCIPTQIFSRLLQKLDSGSCFSLSICRYTLECFQHIYRENIESGQLIKRQKWDPHPEAMLLIARRSLDMACPVNGTRESCRNQTKSINKQRTGCNLGGKE